MTAPSLPGNPPFLVGRARELSLLRTHLFAARVGTGGLVLMGGEAGIGKTTLAEAIGAEAAGHGMRILTGRCFDRTETPPYGPWLYLFSRYTPLHAYPPLPAIFAEPSTIGNVTSQSALFTTALEFFRALSAHAPLLIVLDDLHWADLASLDLLRFLAQSVETLPIFLIVTYRADELTPRHPLYDLFPTLVREAHALRLDLRPLTDEDVRSVVAARYALPQGEAERLVRYLQGRAEGNPFFAGELLRALEEAGILSSTGEQWTLADLTQARLPLLLRQVIDSRLARLGQEAHHRLAVAAVIGQEVPLILWATVAMVDEDALLDVLERGVEARLLEESPDGTRVRFVHALIREAVYEGTLATRRRRLHQRIGDALTATADAEPDAVAYHFQQAGDTRAAAWLITAGTRARLAYAFVTAAARYEAAIVSMGEHPTAASEWGWTTYLLANSYYFIAPARAIAILTQVIDTAARQHEVVLEALARYQRGLIRWTNEHSLTPVDEMLAAVRTLETVSATEIAPVHHYLDPHYSLDDDRAGLARSLYVAGRFTEARSFAEPLVSSAQTPLTYSYATGAEVLGMLAASCGQPDEARRWLRPTHEGLRAVRIHAALVHHIVFEILLFHLPYEADRPEAGTALIQEAEETEALARDAGMADYHIAMALPVHILHGAWSAAKRDATAIDTSSYSPRMYALPHRAYLALHQGEWERVDACIAELLPAGPATEPGTVRFHHTFALLPIAVARALHAGDHMTARAWLEAHDRWLAWSGVALGRSEGEALWAAYYQETGDRTVAYQHAASSLSYATVPRQPVALLGAHRLLGELATEARQFDTAQTHFDAALALADACQAPFDRARTLLAMAEWRAAIGATREALTLLAEIRTICRPLDAKPVLARADALTMRLSGAKTTSPVYPAGLSAREVEVLRLIAAGQTNRSIADALCISPRTINIHVTHILTKTHSANRTEAAAFAHRHGLG